MGGIGVITNPRSRQNRRNPQLSRQLSFVLGGDGAVAVPSDLNELQDVAERFKKHGVDVVAINGGDGTNHTVLSALWRVWGDDEPLPRVALLRGGTQNTVATGLGLKGTPEGLLGKLVLQYNSGAPLRTAERNLLVVDEDQAGFLFGNGFISNFLEAYYELPDPTPAGAAWLLIRAGLSVLTKRGELGQRISRPARGRVTVDGEVWPHEEWGAISVGGVHDIGLGFKPHMPVLHYPGYMHALGAACPPSEVLWQFPRIYRGLPPRHPRIHDAVCRRLVIESDAPQTYQIDGDFHRAGQTVTVRVGPRVHLVI